MRRRNEAPMFSSFRNLFRLAPDLPRAAIPAGERVYAVGDIHGRLDLLRALADAIDADDSARGPSQTTVVVLGDLVDRGPDSAGVIAFVRDWMERRRVRCIAGNHEQMFLDSFDDNEVLRHFLKYGGRETVLSYPIDPADYARADLSETRALMKAAVPQADREFLGGFEDMIAIGDYLFVHAGIRPGIELADQKVSDLRWIRHEFTEYGQPFGPVVVHGHTITETPDLRVNRIGIDTGAFRSGELTALALEGEARWLLSTTEQDGAIRVTQRSLP